MSNKYCIDVINMYIGYLFLIIIFKTYQLNKTKITSQIIYPWLTDLISKENEYLYNYLLLYTIILRKCTQKQYHVQPLMVDKSLNYKYGNLLSLHHLNKQIWNAWTKEWMKLPTHTLSYISKAPESIKLILLLCSLYFEVFLCFMYFAYF